MTDCDPLPRHFPEILSGDLRIVEFGEQHLTPRYVAWLNDPETVRFSEQRYRVHTIESCRDYFSAQLTSSNYFLAIEEITGGIGHIGNMGVTLDTNNCSADISILIGEKALRGRGLGLRAWKAVLDACLGRLGLRLVTAGTMDSNRPMVRVFEKSGMSIEAVLPGRFLWDGGEAGLVLASLHRRNHTETTAKRPRP
jgi:RimJ/RimL family protein N-acetyltransferase